MKAQIMLEGGPFDMNLISYGSSQGAFPDELRIARLPEPVDGTVEAAVYIRVDVSEMPASLMWYGLYRFSGIRDSAPSLVKVWI